jgi:hypothetical protein
MSQKNELGINKSVAISIASRKKINHTVSVSMNFQRNKVKKRAIAIFCDKHQIRERINNALKDTFFYSHTMIVLLNMHDLYFNDIH